VIFASAAEQGVGQLCEKCSARIVNRAGMEGAAQLLEIHADVLTLEICLGGRSQCGRM
jgi:hypothetical protein